MELDLPSDDRARTGERREDRENARAHPIRQHGDSLSAKHEGRADHRRRDLAEEPCATRPTARNRPNHCKGRQVFERKANGPSRRRATVANLDRERRKCAGKRAFPGDTYRRGLRPKREFQRANGPAATDAERRFAGAEAAEGETIGQRRPARPTIKIAQIPNERLSPGAIFAADRIAGERAQCAFCLWKTTL